MEHRKKKSLGQHFLRDAHYAEVAAAAADLRSTDVVLEIGPGEGVLTRVLAPRVAEVVAIELDSDLARRLDVPGARVLAGDAVEIEFPRFDACVSNLPYQVSSPILFKLLDREFRVAVLMVQKEFADRLVARPDTPEYGRLSVMAQTRADIDRVARVPRGAFDPPPAVESALVRLRPRPPRFAVEDWAMFAAVVRAAFTQRRKTLSNAISNAAHLVGAPAGAVKAAARDAPFADRRAGELTPEEFGRVADHVTRAGVRPAAVSAEE